MDSFSQTYKMAVFGVKYRLGLIDAAWKSQLYAVIGTLLKDCGHEPIAIGGISDHIHILYSEGRTGKNSADTMDIVKTESSRWINNKRLTPGKLAWQHGYAVFSYSISGLAKVREYVNNQDRHHKKINFREEIQKFCQAWDINPHPNGLPAELE